MTAGGATPAIEVRGLRASYGERVVLDGLDLAVPAGTVCALLGPNGAGKTTTVNVLSTLLRPDAGQVRVAGHDVRSEPDAVRAAIGVTGQFSAVDALLTGRENLLLMADLHRLPRRLGRGRVDRLLADFGLLDSADVVAMSYSGGMRRRLDLAMTLVGEPRVIFLDEPTTGLDPRGRQAMWGVVRRLVASGVTILLTTQYLDEADALADAVAVLDTGRIVAHGTPAELKRRVAAGHVELRLADPAGLATAARLVAGAVADPAGLVLRVPNDGGVAALRGLLNLLEAHGVAVSDLDIRTPDLDDVFFAVTGTAGPSGPTAPLPAGRGPG